MSTTEYKVDRTGWNPGPWDQEPDRVPWNTDVGLVGLLVRNEFGAWCGYVGVAPGHPDYEKPYMEVENAIEVHGGLSYSNACATHICHVPVAGEPDNLWWFGFDCLHGYDRAPGFAMSTHLPPDPDWTYKTEAYVREQVEKMAKQFAARAR